MCHLLIDRMPDQNIEESFECLRNVYEWASYFPPEQLLPAPAKPATRAKLAARRQRPEFYAEE